MKSDSLVSAGRSNSVETNSLIHIETQSRKSELGADIERNTTATAVKEKLIENAPQKVKAGSAVR